MLCNKTRSEQLTKTSYGILFYCFLYGSYCLLPVCLSLSGSMLPTTPIDPASNPPLLSFLASFLALSPSCLESKQQPSRDNLPTNHKKELVGTVKHSLAHNQVSCFYTLIDILIYIQTTKQRSSKNETRRMFNRCRVYRNQL